jgi:hypothetical protein
MPDEKMISDAPFCARNQQAQHASDRTSCKSPIFKPGSSASNWRLVLLRHKLQRTRSFKLERGRPFVFAPQHGQRERTATSFAMSRRRMVVIEFGT